MLSQRCWEKGYSVAAAAGSGDEFWGQVVNWSRLSVEEKGESVTGGTMYLLLRLLHIYKIITTSTAAQAYYPLTMTAK